MCIRDSLQTTREDSDSIFTILRLRSHAVLGITDEVYAENACRSIEDEIAAMRAGPLKDLTKRIAPDASDLDTIRRRCPY